jgi:hypothetical protein
MLFKFSKVYNVDRFYGDHFKDVKYAMRRPDEYERKLKPHELLVHGRPVGPADRRPAPVGPVA